MSNTITNLRDDTPRARRARWVGDQLSAERWSTRKAALAIGTSHTTLASRLRGATVLDVEEIDALARLLRRDSVSFYAAYMDASTYDGSDAEGSHLSESNRRPVHYMTPDATSSIVNLDVFRTRHEVVDYTATSTSV